MSHSHNIFPDRTDRERAVVYLKRPVSRRPKAAPQTGALFPEPERQERTLVPVDGWPDCRSLSLAGRPDDYYLTA